MDLSYTFKLNGKVYKWGDIFDKEIYANPYTGTKMYILAEQTDAAYAGRIREGQLIGKVFSFIKRPGISFVMVENRFKNSGISKLQGKSYIYVPVDSIASKDLGQMGVKPVEDQIKEEQEQQGKDNETFGDKALKTLKTVGFVAIGGYFLIQLFKHSKYSK